MSSICKSLCLPEIDYWISLHHIWSQAFLLVELGILKYKVLFLLLECKYVEIVAEMQTHSGSPLLHKVPCQDKGQCLTQAVRCFLKAQGDRLYYMSLSQPFCLISGLCAITGVSVFANMLVTNFWMSTTNMYQGMQNVQNR